MTPETTHFTLPELSFGIALLKERIVREPLAGDSEGVFHTGQGIAGTPVKGLCKEPAGKMAEELNHMNIMGAFEHVGK